MTSTKKLGDKDRIVLLVRDNPRRAGTAAARRAAAVMRSKTVQEALRKGALRRTVLNLVDAKIIRLIVSKK